MKPRDLKSYIQQTIRESWQVKPVSKSREAQANAFATKAQAIADKVYGGVYNVNFHSIGRDGTEWWKVQIHSPTGPVKFIYRQGDKWFYSSGEGVNSTFKEIPSDDTMTRGELKEVIKQTLRTILTEMHILETPKPFKKKDEEEDPIEEMTVTGDVAPINLPGNVKGGWVSGKGGSQRGVAGSGKLGYTLTAIGKKDMQRKQDPV